MFQHLAMHCFYQFLLMFSIFTRMLSLAHLFYAYFTHGPNTSAWSKHSTTILGEPGLANPRGMYYNGKEGRKEPLLITSYNRPTGRACHILISSASRVIKATRCDWLLATTNVDFARTLQDFRLTDSIFESVRRLLCSVRANSTIVVASSQSQRVAFMTRSATVTFAINNYGGLVD